MSDPLKDPANQPVDAVPPPSTVPAAPPPLPLAAAEHPPIPQAAAREQSAPTALGSPAIAVTPANPETGVAPPPLPSPGAMEPPPIPPLLPPTLPVVEQRSPRLPVWLGATLACVGLALLGLSIAVAQYSARQRGAAFAVGGVLGVIVIWPAIIIALFSIGRTFRTPRNRGIILLSVWGLMLLGQLGQLGNYQKSRTTPRREAAPAAPSLSFDQPREALPLRLSRPTEVVAPPPLPSLVENPGKASAASAASMEFDLSRGSDERLIKSISSAQEDRYHAVVAAYTRACETRRRDARLAYERVRFIEHFANAEDIEIKESQHDLEVAAAYLTSQFPTSPGSVIYQLQREYGPEFDEKADGFAGLTRSWSGEDRAQFELLRAQRTDRENEKHAYARSAFDAAPSVAAGLILLDHYQKTHQRPPAIQLLQHPIFDQAESYERVEVMDHLFEAGQGARAIALFHDLQEKTPEMLRSFNTVRRIATAGRVDLARDLLAQMPTTGWTGDRRSRERFDFELEFGTAQEAATAYQALRDAGIKSDPLLRERARLFMKSPSVGWSFRDLVGLCLLGLALLGMAALPAVILLPVHYWSLLRERRGRPRTEPTAKWGLREAWFVTGLLLATELGLVWLFQPEEVRSWWSASHFAKAPAALTDEILVLEQGLAWAAMALFLGIVAWRARASRVLGAGQWGWGPAIGAGFGGAFALRVFLFAYALAWPGVLREGMTSISPATEAMCRALRHEMGAFGLILCLAGLVPILEELLFRGVLLQALSKHIPFWAANTLQAMLFASVHESLGLFPFFTLFGVVCGVLARRSGGLLPAILLHTVNNLIACGVFLVKQT